MSLCRVRRAELTAQFFGLTRLALLMIDSLPCVGDAVGLWPSQSWLDPADRAFFLNGWGIA